MNRIGHLLFAIPLVVSLFFAQQAGGHGTTYQVLNSASTITTQFSYTNDDPLRYAKVLIFGPEDGNIEYQNGRTDRRGIFAFCPDRKGIWKIQVNDGMGHVINAEIEVPEMAKSTIEEVPVTVPEGRSITPLSKMVRVVAGLSLVLNVFFAAYLWKGRTR